jgi:thiamine-phosphate pyrophosphorylase
MLPQPPVMLITDAAQAVLPLDEIIKQSLIAGCRWVLLRDITADDDALYAQALHIKKICDIYHAKLFISRNASVAKRIGADGLHLSSSQDIFEARSVCGKMILGKSCHSIQDIMEAESNGADYVSFSPIFETLSKPGYGPAQGLKKLKEVCNLTKLPIIALGGIDALQAQTCIDTGAHGIAVMGDIMRSTLPSLSMQRLLEHIKP